MSVEAMGRQRARSMTPAKALLVAGIMSGTSADGVDIAICRIGPGKDGTPRVKVLGHRGYPYTKAVRNAVLAAMNAKRTSVAELSRLAWRLGEIYASAVEDAACELKLRPQLVACHGQTIYHQAVANEYLGAPVRCTWQIGEASIIAERMRVPVVSDFRPADMAVGGQGAPLVPMLDLCLFGDAKKDRVLLNLGGIGNMTALPAGCGADKVLAFDSGPANMVIDACMRRLYGREFDRDGAVAARGRVLEDVVARFGALPYFSAPAPKSCGREEFGEVFVSRFLARCERSGARKQDVIATATALTASTVVGAFQTIVLPHLRRRTDGPSIEVLAAGGGTRNPTLMRWLSKGFEELGARLDTTAAVGVPPEAKEAAAFALLGWLTWHGLPGNLPRATGASRAVVLGKVTRA